MILCHDPQGAHQLVTHPVGTGTLLVKQRMLVLEYIEGHVMPLCELEASQVRWDTSAKKAYWSA